MTCQAEALSSRPEPLLLELLAEGTAVEIPVTGASMAPLIRTHDVLTLAPLEGRPVGLGDIVAFLRPDGRLVVHRVIATAPGRVRTRGDAAPAADGWTDKASLVGRACKVERNGRSVRLGLGFGRLLFAVLSRLGLLAPLLRPWRWLARVR